MMDLSWDLTALLIVVGVAGLVLVMIRIFYWLQRAWEWHRVRKYSRCYLPHAQSHKPWADNQRVLR